MDVKNFLYAWCGKNKYVLPNYKCEEVAADLTQFRSKKCNEKCFKATVFVRIQKGVDVAGSGVGTNTKIARTLAAGDLCTKLVTQGFMTQEEFQSLTIAKKSPPPPPKKIISQFESKNDETAQIAWSSLTKKKKRNGSIEFISSTSNFFDKTPPESVRKSTERAEIVQIVQKIKNKRSYKKRNKKSAEDCDESIVLDAALIAGRSDSSYYSLENFSYDSNELSEETQKRQKLNSGDFPKKKKFRVEEKICSDSSEEEEVDGKNLESLKNLDDQLWRHYYTNRQSDEQFALKFSLADQITKYLQEVFADECRLWPVGSTVNRLGSYNADLDLCFIVNDEQLQTFSNDKDSERDVALIVLKKLRKFMYKGYSRRCRAIELIPAKIPILRICEFSVNNDDRVDMDINFNNVMGIRNSHLLHCYSLVDDRFPALALAVKHWAILEEICDAKNGMLSSYALHLMIINFLQCGVRPAILPNLQRQFPKVFDVGVPLESLTLRQNLVDGQRVVEENKQTLAELLLEFFRWINRVNFYVEALSIYDGCKISRAKLRDFREQQLCYIYVVEPFEFVNVARCVLKEECFLKIKDAFRRAYETLSVSGDLKSLGVHVD